MPEDSRTAVPDLSPGFLPDAPALGREVPEAVLATGGPPSTAGEPAGPGASADDEPRVEVTCGGCRRPLRLRIDYLGRFVVCQHCGQRFLARIGPGAAEGGSAGPPAREGPIPWPPGPRPGGTAEGPNGFENLAARIRRESRLQDAPPALRDARRAGRSAGPGPPPRPRDSSEDRLKGERDSALAEVARLAADLGELRPRLAELEARLAAVPDADAGSPGPDDPVRPMADRVRSLEDELDRVRAELGSAATRHREALDRLERDHAEARARWAEERSGHPGAIERAAREASSSAEAELDALREELELARARAAEEVGGLVARAEQGRQSADRAERDREAADRRADDLRRERDSWLERCAGLEERARDLEARLDARSEQGSQAAEEAEQGRLAAVRHADDLYRERDALLARCEGLEARAGDLEARLAARAEEADLAAAEAERLRRDEVDGLARELERARDREQEAAQQLSSPEGRVGELQAALDLERERAAADREAREGDREDRLSEELAESRGREDRDAARIAALEGRVEELLSALDRESERAEAEGRGRAADREAADRQAEAARASLEAEVARLRRTVEETEGGRDAERERAAGLARGADDLAARLAAVEPVLASLRRLEAEMARQSAELALSREAAAAASRHNSLLLEQLGSLRDEWDSRRREESAARPPVDERRAPSPVEDRRPDPAPAPEAEAGPVEAGREVLGSSPGPDPVEDRAGGEDIAAVPIVEATPGPRSTPEDGLDPAPAGRRGRASEVSIVLRGVSKEYRRDKFRIPVLQDLDLSVEQGEFLALMGPSGSGKTTLLNLIAGLDQATAGSVVVHGHELTGLNEAQLTRWRANNVGFVFQMYNLVPVMTAFRNVELPLLLTRLSSRQRRENAMTALRIVGLEGREDHYPRQLSGGQEQRVSIARAIVTDPHLIVADEPTGDLDRKSADEILNLLGSLNREFRKTIVMVTHDPQAAQRATRLLHLDKGKLVGDTVRPRIYPASSPG